MSRRVIRPPKAMRGCYKRYQRRTIPNSHRPAIQTTSTLPLSMTTPWWWCWMPAVTASIRSAKYSQPIRVWPLYISSLMAAQLHCAWAVPASPAKNSNNTPIASRPGAAPLQRTAIYCSMDATWPTVIAVCNSCRTSVNSPAPISPPPMTIPVASPWVVTGNWRSTPGTSKLSPCLVPLRTMPICWRTSSSLVLQLLIPLPSTPIKCRPRPLLLVKMWP